LIKDSKISLVKVYIWNFVNTLLVLNNPLLIMQCTVKWVDIPYIWK
jgi:hypothetical protein